MTTTSVPPSAQIAQIGRRFGYTIAALLNGVMLFIVNNVESWDLAWLTQDFDKVLTLVNLTLAASLLANIVYIGNDRVPVKPVGEIITTALGLVATVRVFNVFPFDFSAYDFNWEFMTRAVLIVAMVGSVIGIIVQAFKLARAQ